MGMKIFFIPMLFLYADYPFSSFILDEITAIIVPMTAIRPNEMRRLVAWAMNPINGGPNKNPR